MSKAVCKDYKKVKEEVVEEVRKEHCVTATKLDIGDRMYRTVPREAFITLKDHKKDFLVRPTVRLINPTKSEVGRVAMKMLDGMVKEIRALKGLKQFISTKEVIEKEGEFKVHYF